MLSILRHPTYRALFLAQVVALVGTGLATVALGLLAYDLAGADAGVVLGGALAIKMVAYIGVGPAANAFADRLPRKTLLVSMDLVRAAVALLLPFVDQVWQVYVLIFLLQSASAAFTPTFQAIIPDILPEEAQYTRALSLSRLAYDLESVVSPILAAALLTIISFNWLFSGTVVGFLASAALVISAAVPRVARPSVRRDVFDRTTRGSLIYLRTPRLRGLLALTLAAAAVGAFVIVNTIVLVRVELGRPANDVAVALAAFGGGSMVAALLLPRVLDRRPDRPVMLVSAALLVLGLLATAGLLATPSVDSWLVILWLWPVLGLAYSAVQTPGGRLLRRSSSPDDRSALFAAQFALSHGCWLLAYSIAGWFGARAGLPVTAAILAGVAAAGLAAALVVWPRRDPEIIEHAHPDLPADDPHLLGAEHGRHAHAFVIDDEHSTWPRPGL